MLYVNYNELVQQPRANVEQVSEFLCGRVSIDGMVKAVDPSLYRNRKSSADPIAGPTA